MSYQVLARKWRPQNFQQMVGQEHVLKALANALDQDRLHHAYLFSGTRGVGKTTIARIFAKSLNCETGITSQPCGQCAACTEIVEGRFVDLIEIDAASRTKVEDMRELLDNVQYAPTRSRYKIYLIDEVHMLSNSSFNALLKTLEEPPPHIKFLLATTDPQKLPVTVLSRCLQFNLKNLSAERIVKHLTYILGKEQVDAEEPALWELAKAADGSMRDALSLTDQCIAFGSGKITTKEVLEMLGTLEKHVVLELLELIAAGDAKRLFKKVELLGDFSPDYAFILQAMAELLHRVAVEQVLPGSVDNSFGDQQNVVALARSMTAEDTQLYYEIALISRKDIGLAPDPRTGFEMALLRMLTFRPNIKAGQPQGHALSAADKATPSTKATNGGATTRDTLQPKDQASAIQQSKVQAPAPVSKSLAAADSSVIAEEAPVKDHWHNPVGDGVLKTEFAKSSQPEPVKVMPVDPRSDSKHGASSQPLPDMPLPPLEAYGDIVMQAENLSEQINDGHEEGHNDGHKKGHTVQIPMNEKLVNKAPTDTIKPPMLSDSSSPTPAEMSASVAGEKPVDGDAADQQNTVQQKKVQQKTVQHNLSDGQSLEEDFEEEEQYVELQEVVLDTPVANDVSFSAYSGTRIDRREPLLHEQRWSEIVSKLALKGMAYSLSQRLVLTAVLGERLEFVIDEDHYDFFNLLQQNRLSDALSEFTGKTIRIVVKPGQAEWLSPLQEIEVRQAELQTAAEQEIHGDQNIRKLIEVFDAAVVENSIEPVINNERTG